MIEHTYYLSTAAVDVRSSRSFLTTQAFPGQHGILRPHLRTNKNRRNVTMGKSCLFFTVSLDRGPATTQNISRTSRTDPTIVLPSNALTCPACPLSVWTAQFITHLLPTSTQTPSSSTALASQPLTAKTTPCLLLGSTNKPTHPQAFIITDSEQCWDNLCACPSLDSAPISKTEFPPCLGHLTRIKST